MKTTALLGSLLVACLLVGSGVGSALAGEKAAKPKEAKPKISKAEAQRIALARVAKVKACELETENGKLVWSFDIATKGSENTVEVLVNARNGKVVSVQIETPADEAKEAAENHTAGKPEKQLEGKPEPRKEKAGEAEEDEQN